VIEMTFFGKTPARKRYERQTKEALNDLDKEEKIKSIMGFYGLSRSEAKRELKNMGEL